MNTDKSQEIFEKISIRDLNGEQKETIANNIISDVNTTLEYRSQMILSVIIATLGLLVNATPVVIGAMLIAPILRPISGTSFAIATGNRKLFEKSLRLLIGSIVIGIGVGYLITQIVPLSEITNEIAMRTQPTLVDLGIAFASGLIAFLAFGYHKMASGMAGVAMAASLIPPLGVVGIGISFGSRSVGRGSMLLFTTNLIAIIIAGILIFYMFGFYPNQKDDLKRSIINTGYVFGMLFLVSIPLTTSLFRISQDISQKKIIKEISDTHLHAIDPQIVVEKRTSKKSDENNGKEISLGLKVPQEAINKITNETKLQLSQQLATKMSKDINLDVTITPVTTVTAEEAKEASPETILLQETQNYLKEKNIDDQITVLNIDYYVSNKRIALISLYTEAKIQNKEKFKNDLFSSLNEQFDFIDSVSINRQENLPNQESLAEKNEHIKQISSSFDSTFSQETRIEFIDISYQEVPKYKSSDELFTSNFSSLFIENTNLRNAMSDIIQIEKSLVVDLQLSTNLPEENLQEQLRIWKEIVSMNVEHDITLQVKFLRYEILSL